MQVPLSSDIMSDISLTSLGVVVAHVSPWVSSSRQLDLVCCATWQRLHHRPRRRPELPPVVPLRVVAGRAARSLAFRTSRTGTESTRSVDRQDGRC